jgi:uncharacterized repeat protein (TIGR01451 family)
MKGILYSLVFLLSFTKTQAQYHISGVFVTTMTCTGFVDRIRANPYSSGLSLKTFYGNSIVNTDSVTIGGAYADINIPVASAGIVSLKHVLYYLGSPVDSVRQSFEYLDCNAFAIKVFNDVAGSGIYDGATDPMTTIPIKVQVSKNGSFFENIMMTSGCYYSFPGYFGDIFSFKMMSIPPSYSMTTPTGGIIYDTVQSGVKYSTKYFGLRCTGSAGSDLKVFASFRAGSHHFGGSVFIDNTSCVPSAATLSMQLSPKYNSSMQFVPNPTSISGNTVVWNIPSVSSLNPLKFGVDMEHNPSYLPAYGDTVITNYSVTPIVGDLNPSDNIFILEDTIKAGYDPNDMYVSPTGNIRAGTQLKYTINFENTGNDTAFDVIVFDTLSDNVDISSLNLIMASSQMNIAVLQESGHNVIKFDFPNINLLDSSHHGQCDGAVIFTINSKTGLPNGTKIDNRAGIYFDYNPVVMTNTVENIIGIPASVTTVSNNSKVDIYPNPANSELTIITGNGTYNTLNITNTLGQLLTTQPIIGQQTKVNVAELPAGMYYLTLKGDNGVKVQKFMKQ